MDRKCLVCGMNINPEVAIYNTGYPDCCDLCALERQEEFKKKKGLRMDTKAMEAIREALAKATPGKWIESPGDCIDEPAAVYKLVDYFNAQIIADNLLGVDAHLIANAPRWLRQLLDRVELLEQSKADVEHNRNLLSDEKRQLLDENTKLKEHLESEQQDLGDLHEVYVQEAAAHREKARQLQDENGRLCVDFETLKGNYQQLLEENERTLTMNKAIIGARDYWEGEYQIARQEIERLKAELKLEKWDNAEATDQINNLHADKAVAVEALRKAEKFIGAIMEFYGEGLQVINWHQNGDAEPLDNFFDNNTDGDEMEVIRAAIERIESGESHG